MENTWHFPAILPVPLTRLQLPLLASCTAHHKAWSGKQNTLRMREGSPEHWSQFLKSQGWCWCSPVGAAKERLHQSRSMTSNKFFSPMTEDPRVDGWLRIPERCILQCAASCTSEDRSGTDQFWQQKAPALGVEWLCKVQGQFILKRWLLNSYKLMITQCVGCCANGVSTQVYFCWSGPAVPCQHLFSHSATVCALTSAPLASSAVLGPSALQGRFFNKLSLCMCLCQEIRNAL